MEQEKNVKIDFMKVIVTLLVVFAHSSRMYTGYGAIENVSINIFLKNLTEFIYGFHMPFFFFLSGFVFSICIISGKYKNKLKFVINKIKRLLIPYFIFGIFYVTPIMILLNLTNENFIQYIFKNILLFSDSRHLWFLPVLFLIFLITLYIRPKNKKDTIFTVIILFLVSLFSNYFPSIFGNVVKYLVYFYLGYSFNVLYQDITHNKIIKYLLIISLILYVILFYIKFNSNVIGIVGCTMSFIFLYIIPTNVYKNSKLINILSKYSMGIYLFHPMIIYLLYSLFSKYNLNPYLLCIGVFIISIIISMIFTYIIKFMNLNIIIGEKNNSKKGALQHG